MTPENLMRRRQNTLALCACILYLGTKITLLIPFVFFLFMEAILPIMRLSAVQDETIDIDS